MDTQDYGSPTTQRPQTQEASPRGQTQGEGREGEERPQVQVQRTTETKGQEGKGGPIARGIPLWVLVLGLLNTGCEAGYGLAKINDTFDGASFQRDIAYAELTGRIETPVRFCQQLELQGLYEKTIHGIQVDTWEVSTGCFFGFGGTEPEN